MQDLIGKNFTRFGTVSSFSWLAPGRRGEPARIQQWRLTRPGWERVRRADIELTGVEECRPILGIG